MKKVKSLKINGINPTELQALIDGRYPFYKTFSITTWGGSSVENSHAKDLKTFLLQQVDKLDDKYLFASHSKLRNAGWQFDGYELTGPQQKHE